MGFARQTLYRTEMRQHCQGTQDNNHATTMIPPPTYFVWPGMVLPPRADLRRLQQGRLPLPALAAAVRRGMGAVRHVRQHGVGEKKHRHVSSTSMTCRSSCGLL